MHTFWDLKQYEEFLTTVGKDLNNINFTETSGAVITRLGVNNQINGTLTFIPDDIVSSFDLSKDYEIVCNDEGNIIQFSFNITEEGKTTVRGAQGFSIFYQYIGKLINLSKKTEVTDLTGKPRN
jgi:hypothetical protein